MARGMLVYARMKSAFVVAAVLVASGGVAKAGGYLGLGIGTSPGVSDSNDKYVSDGRSGRLFGGFRFGQISAEGALNGYGLGIPGGAHTDAKELSIAGKFNLPIGDNFEAFGRLGLERTWLSVDGKPDYDAQGNGYLIGVGMEYRVKLTAVSGSLFVDYSHHSSSFEGRTKFDASVRMWMLGFSVGF